MVDNSCGLNPKGFLFDGYKTEMNVKEIQRAIFDQNLGTTFEAESKGLDTIDGCSANHVRGKNMPYFLIEDKDDKELHSATEIKNLRNDSMESGEKSELDCKAVRNESQCPSISEEISQDLTEELKFSGLNYSKYIEQDSDEEKLFPYECSFESINKTVTKNWMWLDCHFAESTSSSIADLPISTDSKSAYSICGNEVNSKTVLEDSLNPRKLNQSFERVKMSKTKYESEDYGNMKNTDEQGNKNSPNYQENISTSDEVLKKNNYDDKRKLEKEDCREMLKKSKIKKSSSEPEVKNIILKPEREVTKN